MTRVTLHVTADDVREADEDRVRALFIGEALHPDPQARVRLAEVLYEITGWDTFAYAALAASETPEQAEEHRRILRRRRPPWADED
ncbi:MAG: hypothetical protein ACRDPY_26135 [Streptosporangiaceae bacterium]